jgi:anti-sigma factor RsiW
MERLSEYLDGELDGPERETLEAHLRQCAECARVLEDLRKVRARARELTRVPAPAELWPRIEKAIAQGGGAAASPTITPLGSPRASRFFSLPELLAACLAVAIVSGGAVYAVLRHERPAARTERAVNVAPGPEVRSESEAAEPRPEASEERRAEPPAAVTAVPAVRTDAGPDVAAQTPETPHEEAISELRKALARERDRLDPTTIRTLEANLAIIDLAIDQAKRALAADPADSYVKEHLAETMRRKVELLQRATLLASTSNSEGPR